MLHIYFLNLLTSIYKLNLKNSKTFSRLYILNTGEYGGKIILKIIWKVLIIVINKNKLQPFASPEINLQSLIDHTIRRLCAAQTEVLSSNLGSCREMEIVFKWGCDLATQNKYKQIKKGRFYYRRKLIQYLDSANLVILHC